MARTAARVPPAGTPDGKPERADGVHCAQGPRHTRARPGAPAGAAQEEKVATAMAAKKQAEAASTKPCQMALEKRSDSQAKKTTPAV